MPKQSIMFTTQDLPLFSATAPRTHDSVFTEREPEPQQLPLPDSVTACPHPPARLFSGMYFDPVTCKDTLWIGCLECGAILKD